MTSPGRDSTVLGGGETGPRASGAEIPPTVDQRRAPEDAPAAADPSPDAPIDDGRSSGGAVAHHRPGPDGTMGGSPVAASGATAGRTTAAGADERKSRASQSFWTVVVGVPAIFSVLRLGVEAGGELQTTLLLVANVNPVNLAAALVTTAARLVSAGLVAVFAIGAVLLVSSEHASTHRIGRHPPLFARWRAITPPWVVLASFAVAIATWPILYLPLLLPAFAAAFQLSSARLDERRVPRLLLLAGLLAGYLVLMLPTLRDAWGQREIFAVLVIATPPALALFVSGPIPIPVARPLAMAAQVAVLAMLCWAALPVITTPVLPLTVTTARDDADGIDPTAPSTATGGVEEIRGHVISVDDVNMVILEEHGGVRYVPVGQVEAQVLCPTEEQLPRYRLRIHGFHVEDSLLEGMGRRVRPVNRVDAACRTPSDTGFLPRR